MVVSKERFLVVQLELMGEARTQPTLAVLQGCVRDSIHTHFGDFGLGCVLMTLQGPP